jgi:protein arginine N-methyltransferase 3
MHATHGFDFHTVRRQLGLDFYGCIKIINYIRSQSKADPAVAAANPYPPPAPAAFASDEFLMPVLADDVLLQQDYDDYDEAAAAAAAAGSSGGGGGGGGADGSTGAAADAGAAVAGAGKSAEEVLAAKCAALEGTVQAMKEEFALFRSSTEAAVFGGMTVAELKSDGEQYATELAAKPKTAGAEAEIEDVESYFIGYAHYGIHEEMLKDKVRTETYRDSMYKNKDYFKGKVVLDVGCGSGILSMFAAQSGAAKVIGVDNSSVLTTAAKIIKQNGLDHIITLVRGKIEEVTLPVEQVDIIISEWMGYFLVFESMMDSVIFARDKWLKPGGIVLPDECSMYLVAMIDDERVASRMTFWDDVYGFKMDALKEHLYPEPDVTIINPNALASKPFLLKEIDVSTTTVDYEFSTPFALKMEKDGVCAMLEVHFDIGFVKGLPEPVYFSTGPKATPTHWKQTLFYLQTPMTVAAGDVIEGKLSATRCAPPDDPRHWLMEIEYKTGAMELCTQKYRM